VTDFRKFLAGSVEAVLPYFGGTRVDAPDRPLRVAGEPERGWWKWKVEGRRAVPIEKVPPADLSDRPVVRGHWSKGWIFESGREQWRVALPPDEEPSPLARVSGRRWHSGDLLFDSIDFEDDAEISARLALEQRQPLGDVKHIPPSLRAAFGYALVAAVGDELDIPISPREARPRILDIAAGGRPVATELLFALADERKRHSLLELAARMRPRARNMRQNPEQRADAALDAAGARMLACRRTGDTMEVTLEVDGERIISVVDPDSLHVYDSGICLSGADEELTLDSLPSVIREAIRVDHLNITRRAR
jgi:hypothetical protein